ncbi:MAG: TolC family outer membrane protein, partial [Xanthomonadaceae bacterium]|nr:TolC family outer membrane protein [Xanthomonadaceae bacterium]
MKKILTGAVLMALSGSVPAVDLLGVYELASTNDPQIRAAERRLDASVYEKAIARANLLPEITGFGSLNRGNTQVDVAALPPQPDRKIDTETYSVQLRQSLYADANFGQMNRARAIVAQANAQFDVAWQNFLQRTAQRYFDMLNAIDSLRFAEAEEKALRRQFEQAEQRFEVGLSAVTDFLEAQAAWDGARARVIVAENALENAREGLRELTGTMFESFKPLAENLPLNPPEPAVAEQWVSTALQSNPDLAVARQAVNIADTDIRIARSGHLPTLDLVGTLNRNINNEQTLTVAEQFNQVTTSESDTWQVQLQLNVPIFSGFAVRSRTLQARANRGVASEELDLNQRQTVRTTENAFRAVIAGIRQVEALNQALVSADSALEATNAGFEVGTRTIVDVLLAEQRFFQAQRDYSNARHQLIL